MGFPRRKMKTAAIMPAYNEEVGIADVIRAVQSAKLVDEIIVISDGSTDKTVEIAQSFENINVFEQTPNKGKAAAMHLGVSKTDADVLLFIDCDLINLSPEMVDALVKPILDDTADVTMGIFQGGKFSTDWAQKTFPFLTGQRGMKRSVWDGADIDVKSGYAVEVHLTKYMAKENLRVENVVLTGCSQYLKEQKTKGKVLEGFGRRLKMTWEIAKALFMPDFDDIADIFAPKTKENGGEGGFERKRFRDRGDRDGGDRRPRKSFDRKPWVADGEFNKSWREKRDDEKRERRPRRDDEGGSEEGGEERPARPRREGGFFRKREDGGEGFKRSYDRPRRSYDDSSSGGDRPPRRDYSDRPPRREGGGGFFGKREGGDRKPFFGRPSGDGERRGGFGRPKKFGDNKPFGDRPPRRPRD
jgi:glycosyltransferase involved in cell wall biosynthesis